MATSFITENNLLSSLDDAEQMALSCKETTALLIAGPTTSGKSSFAIRLAERFNGVVINADSMQVYQDLNVLTARPTLEEIRSIPHWLYGYVDGAINFSVGHYIKDAKEALNNAEREGMLPIFVGGTGLYFKALLEGLSPIPEVPENIREHVRTQVEGKETPLLHKQLSLVDSKAAENLNPNDRLRIMRALEVYEATGTSLLDFHNARIAGPLNDKKTLRFFLAPDRETIRRKIDERFHMMMDGGALEEVQSLAERKLDPLLPIMRAHGVPGLLQFLKGTITREAAITRGQGDTRRYAKRQMTWARHQMNGWTWVTF